MTTRTEHARALLKLGFAVIPVPARSKNPNRKCWEQERWTEAELPARFAGKGNIGVLLGEPSGWLVDVDLDDPRALELAETLLPHTGLVWGRCSKPQSHWIYRVTSPVNTKAWKNSNGTEIVSLRSTGAQSIAPGSEHDKTGERVEWHGAPGNPGVLSPDDLVGSIEQLVQAIKSERGDTGVVPSEALAPSMRPTGTPEEFVDSLMLTGPGQRDKATWQLARGLKHDFGLTREVANQLFERWLDASLMHMSNPSRTMARKEFDRAWGNAMFGLAGTKDLTVRAWQECQGATLSSAVLTKFPVGKIQDLYRLAQRMSYIVEGKSIALSSHAAARLIGVAQKTAYYMIRDLEDAGALELVQRGKAGPKLGTATLYKFRELTTAPTVSSDETC